VTSLQNFYGMSPTLWVGILIDKDDEAVSTRLFLSRNEAESWLCQLILASYDDVDTDDEDNDWHDVDLDDLAEVLEKDGDQQERYGMTRIKEIDLYQHLPQLAPSANLALPDAAHMP